MNKGACLDVTIRTEEGDVLNTKMKVYEDVFDALLEFHTLILRLGWEEEYD